MKNITEPLSLARKIVWVTLFSIAMGYLETAVVVYIRKHYYPDGFRFPLVPIGTDIAITEVWREAATIIMLAGIGIICGNNRKERFAYFVYSFAVWDIFYYVFLYVLLGWPSSIMTFDVLFLIPMPWVSPVLCPVLISSLMIFYFFIVICGRPDMVMKGMRLREKLIMLTGMILVLFSFVRDYAVYVFANYREKGVWTYSSKKELFSESAGFVPTTFPWIIFMPGFLLMCGAVGLYFLRVRKRNTSSHDEWKQY